MFRLAKPLPSRKAKKTFRIKMAKRILECKSIDDAHKILSELKEKNL